MHAHHESMHRNARKHARTNLSTESLTFKSTLLKLKSTKSLFPLANRVAETHLDFTSKLSHTMSNFRVRATPSQQHASLPPRTQVSADSWKLIISSVRTVPVESFRVGALIYGGTFSTV